MVALLAEDISLGSSDFRCIGFVTDPAMVFFSAAIAPDGLVPAKGFLDIASLNLFIRHQ
jgi:hypothetical protein